MKNTKATTHSYLHLQASLFSAKRLQEAERNLTGYTAPQMQPQHTRVLKINQS